MRVADACLANGGHIAWEWPKPCTYWRDKRVQAFITRHRLQSVVFDGCAYGVVSQQGSTAGRPIKKSWRVAYSCDAFQALRRPCTHAPGEHVRLQGADTRLSESYTDELASAIHACWRSACVSHIG